MRSSRDRNILFNFSTGSKELENAFGGAVKASVLSVNNNWGLDHIASTEGLFVLLVGENVFASDHSFGGTVLAWLSSGKRNDLAGEFTLHHEEGAWLSSASFDKCDVGGT